MKDFFAAHLALVLIMATTQQSCTGSKSDKPIQTGTIITQPGPQNLLQVKVVAPASILTNRPIFIDAKTEHAIAFAWEQISGPSTLNFSNADGEDTTVSASIDGIYEIRLNASDANQQSASATVRLTWDTEGPSVQLSESLKTSKKIRLQPTVGADGKKFFWSKISGPGALEFGDETASATDVTASQDGEYVLRLTVKDEAGNETSKELRLTWESVAPLVQLGEDVYARSKITVKPVKSEAIRYEWTLIKGPGSLHFDQPHNSETGVIADVDGDYHLRLTGTMDNGATSSDDMILSWDTVAPLLSTQNRSLKSRCMSDDEAILNVDASGAAGFIWAMNPTSERDYQILHPQSEDTSFIAQEGQYQLFLTASDRAGNSSSLTISVDCDQTAPALQLSQIDEVQPSPFSVQVQLGEADARLQWLQRSGPQGVKIAVDSSVGKVRRLSLEAAEDGRYEFVLVAQDSVGNKSEQSLRFTWNAKLPTIGQLSDVEARFPVTLKPMVENGTSFKWIALSGPNLSKPEILATTAEATLKFSISGVYRIRFEVLDAEDSIAAREFNLVWDDMKPRIEIDPFYNASEPVELKPVIEDQSTELTYNWDDRSRNKGMLVLSSTNGPKATVSALSDGDYIILLTVTDKLGNRSNRIIHFKWVGKPIDPEIPEALKFVRDFQSACEYHKKHSHIPEQPARQKNLLSLVATILAIPSYAVKDCGELTAEWKNLSPLSFQSPSGIPDLVWTLASGERVRALDCPVSFRKNLDLSTEISSVKDWSAHWQQYFSETNPERRFTCDAVDVEESCSLYISGAYSGSQLKDSIRQAMRTCQKPDLVIQQMSDVQIVNGFELDFLNWLNVKRVRWQSLVPRIVKFERVCKDSCSFIGAYPAYPVSAIQPSLLFKNLRFEMSMSPDSSPTSNIGIQASNVVVQLVNTSIKGVQENKPKLDVGVRLLDGESFCLNCQIEAENTAMMLVRSHGLASSSKTAETRTELSGRRSLHIMSGSELYLQNVSVLGDTLGFLDAGLGAKVFNSRMFIHNSELKVQGNNGPGFLFRSQIPTSGEDKSQLEVYSSFLRGIPEEENYLLIGQTVGSRGDLSRAEFDNRNHFVTTSLTDIKDDFLKLKSLLRCESENNPLPTLVHPYGYFCAPLD